MERSVEVANSLKRLDKRRGVGEANQVAGILKENRDVADYLEALGFGPDLGLARATAPARSAAPAALTPSPATPHAGLSVLFIEDSPSEGASAELLKKMIAAMGLGEGKSRVITLISADELAPLLREANPRFMVALGARAAQALLGSTESITELRGRILSYPGFERSDGSSVELIATFEPALLLQNPGFKKAAWDDLQKVMKKLANS